MTPLGGGNTMTPRDADAAWKDGFWKGLFMGLLVGLIAVLIVGTAQ